VRGVPEERLIDKLQRGITIDGKRTLPCEIARMKTTGRGDDAGNSWFEVRLREGRTQQIRKMFQAVGHPVSKLRRVAIGPLSDPALTPGDWRELTPREVKMLATMREPAKPKPRRAAVERPASKKKSASAGAKKKRASSKTSSRTKSPDRPKPRAARPKPAASRPKAASARHPRAAGGAKRESRRGRG